MITIRITGNPLAEDESCLHLLRKLVKLLGDNRQRSTVVEFQIASPRSSEVATYRFRMTYVGGQATPKGKQR